MKAWILLTLALIGSFALATPAGAAATLTISDEKSEARIVDYVDFGWVRLYDYAYRGLRLTNTGSTMITDLELSISGYGFWGRSDCGRFLAPGERCRIELEFRPTMSGSHWGRFYIVATDVNERIDLYGWGEQQQYP